MQLNMLAKLNNTKLIAPETNIINEKCKVIPVTGGGGL
jgi:hypothetical protein